ncbi:MAG: ATP-dependent Clp protease ATP-binding subunit [Parcubacteria group bacterium]|nr:ATP-dependent Clp protease ATP-binding subunit [Parcubacteria group bacterium]
MKSVSTNTNTESEGTFHEEGGVVTLEVQGLGYRFLPLPRIWSSELELLGKIEKSILVILLIVGVGLIVRGMAAARDLRLLFFPSASTGAAWGGFLLVLMARYALIRRRSAARFLFPSQRVITKRSDGTVNVVSTFSPQSIAWLRKGFQRAARQRRVFHPFYGLAAFLALPVLRRTFTRLEHPLSEIETKLKEYLDVLPQAEAENYSELIQRWALLAFVMAERRGDREVLPEHLAMVFPLISVECAAFFTALDIDPKAYGETLDWMWRSGGRGMTQRKPKELHYLKRVRMNRAWTARPTPALDRVSDDLTDLARVGALTSIVGRSEELAAIERILARTEKRHVLLVGPEGSGRTALIYGLVYRIIRGEALKEVLDKRVVALDSGALVSGAGAQESLDHTLTKILREIEEAGNVILLIPHIHTLTALGSEKLDASQLVAGALSSERFQIIGTTTEEAFNRVLEQRTDITRSFEVVKVREVSIDDAVTIATTRTPTIEATHGVAFSRDAIVKAVALSERYIHDRLRPEKALALLDEAAVAASQRGGRIVEGKDIAHLLSEKIGIPLEAITSDESAHLLKLEEELHARVIDQDQAVAAIAEAVRRSRVGLREERRPIASFLFMGPTGVGKTELAKALASVYYRGEENIFRLDMSEFATVEGMYRLIGAPRDSEEAYAGGELTEYVEKHPYTLVLLDEFEKAHPKIFDLFLQVFDEGHLSDSIGKTVDFTNTIIIATSNAAAELILETLERGESLTNLQERVNLLLTQYFKPELINRFDRIILFEPLGKEEVMAIAEKEMAEVATKLSSQNYEVVFSKELTSEVAALGYDPKFGARPLKRVIQDRVEAVIAKKILAGEIKKHEAYYFDVAMLG